MNNTAPELLEKENIPVIKKNNRKTWVIGMVALVLIAVGTVYAVLHFKQPKEPLSDIPKAENSIDKEEVNLTPGQRQRIESELGD